MSRYRLSRQADEDLDEIATFISNESPQAAEDVLNAMYDTLVSLANHPDIGLSRDDLRPGLNVFPARRPANNYVICYYLIPEGIEVATILHGRRDWAGLFERGER